MEPAMFYQKELATALQHLLQGVSLLTADAGGSTEVHVGSTRLFAPGCAVVLQNRSGECETHTVDQRCGEHIIVLMEPVSGNFTVEDGSVVCLAEPVVANLQWVLVGQPKLMPHPRTLQLPGIVIEPGAMQQPPDRGTNRTYQQEYVFHVFLLQRSKEGENPEEALMEATARIFNRVMDDPYLQGLAWHSQVTSVNPRPPEEKSLRENCPEVHVVRIDVLTRVSALWQG